MRMEVLRCADEIQSWSAWGSWSNCSVGCGFGQQTRERECLNLPEGCGDYHCPGQSGDTRLCYEVQLCSGDMGFQYVDGLLNPTDDPNGTHTWLEARRLQTAEPEAILLRYNRSTLLLGTEGVFHIQY
ncbi:ectin-like [Branchiostoma floridae x Branchiostoma belcheri]